MKSRLIYLPKLSGRKASIYSIISEESSVSLLDNFILENKGESLQDLLSITGRLRSIGSTAGAIRPFFKMDEGLEWDDLGCALYDVPDRHLRLYCIRLNDQIVIAGGGGPKNVRAWQQDPKLGREVMEMMHYSKIIRSRLGYGSLRISSDGLKFEGDLMLTK